MCEFNNNIRSLKWRLFVFTKDGFAPRLHWYEVRQPCFGFSWLVTRWQRTASFASPTCLLLLPESMDKINQLSLIFQKFSSFKINQLSFKNTKWNLSCRQLLCRHPKHGEDGGKMLVPDLVKHLVFARELQLGWGFRFGHVGRELNGATIYSKSLVQEPLIGKRRKKAGGPARKGQSRCGWDKPTSPGLDPGWWDDQSLGCVLLACQVPGCTELLAWAASLHFFPDQTHWGLPQTETEVPRGP